MKLLFLTIAFAVAAYAEVDSLSASSLATSRRLQRRAVPPDGFCGVFEGKTIKCAATDCCSQFNFCGTTTAHCGTGCQTAFGGKCSPVKVLPPRKVPLPANAPQAKVNEQCTSPGMLAVTLDDGHSLQFNKKFLDLLKANKMVATFFINGINGDWDISKHPEIVKKTFDAGHQIAHHTNTHADLALLGDAGIVSELCNLDMGIANALGGLTPRYIRFPFLSYSPQALKIAAFYGYIVVDVNLDTKDFEDTKTAKSKLDFALKQYSTLTKKSTAKDSFISLQHEIEEFTANTLFPKLLPELRTTFVDKTKKQYKLVTVGECLDKGSKSQDWYRKNIWHRDPKKDPKFFCPSI